MTATQPLSAATVLDDIRAMLMELLDEYEPDDIEITAETTFHEDLGLESIDLVAVAAMIAERYGEHVNLAEFLAEKDLDDVIGMRIGVLVDFVLAATTAPCAMMAGTEA
ncbi:MAG: acyl carrier protein [Haloechinothrix sp.]